jgi:hypothetical protein
MPESCTDRPTSAWEHVFLLTKSARYYYDVEAVREECEPETADRYAAGYNASWKRAQIASVTDKRTEGFRGTPTAIKRNLRNFWLLGPEPFSGAHLLRGASGGSDRIVSADCPLHGDRSKLGSMPQDDAQPIASRPVRNPDIDSHREPGLFAAPVSIETHHGARSVPGNSDLQGQTYSPTATEHSNQTRRTDRVLSTSLRDTSAEELGCHTERNEPRPGFDAMSGRIPESKTGEGSELSGQDSDRADQTASGNARKCRRPAPTQLHRHRAKPRICRNGRKPLTNR